MNEGGRDRHADTQRYIQTHRRTRTHARGNGSGPAGAELTPSESESPPSPPSPQAQMSRALGGSDSYGVARLP